MTMTSLCSTRKPTTPNRIQKRQHKVKHPSPLKLSRFTATPLSHHTLSELNHLAAAMIPASPASSGGRQGSCSFRTKLFDNERNHDLEELSYAQPATPLGRDLPGNPHINASQMLLPETTTTTSDNLITEIHSTTSKSGSTDDPANFSFLTVEEFSDTVMVDQLDDDKDIPVITNNNNSRKRKSFSSVRSVSHPRKRVAKITVTALTPRLSINTHQCPDNSSILGDSNNNNNNNNNNDWEDEDISDDWSFITDADITQIPAYGPSTILEITQSLQAILMGQAMAKAREARRKMRTLERSCRTLLRTAFEYQGRVGATKCISVGARSVC